MVDFCLCEINSSIRFVRGSSFQFRNLSSKVLGMHQETKYDVNPLHPKINQTSKSFKAKKRISRKFLQHGFFFYHLKMFRKHCKTSCAVAAFVGWGTGYATQASSIFVANKIMVQPRFACINFLIMFTYLLNIT